MKKKATPREALKPSPAPKEVWDEMNATLEEDAKRWKASFSEHVANYENETGDHGELLKPDADPV